MIGGIGTDIIQISRVEATLGRLGDRFAQRILRPIEFARFQNHGSPARFLAKRFAAKEAAAKALGTGIGRGLSWQHIEIASNENGAPELLFFDFAAESQR